MKRLTAIVWMLILLILLASFPGTTPALAQRPRVTPPLCALSEGQLFCYSAEGTPRAITAPAERGIDFDISPDGEWIAYRVLVGDETHVRIASVFGTGAAYEVDRQATLPATLLPEMQTLVWSPDGITLLYVVASGLRAAFPDAAGSPRYVDLTDRRYVDLRFSPSGTRLAAQAEEGSWMIYAVLERYTPSTRLERIRSLNLTAEVCWLDDERLLVAPNSGGLYTLDTGNPNAQFNSANALGLYRQMIRLPDGSVRALNVEIGQGYATPVQIDAALNITPLGEIKLDTRLQWTQQGRGMVYLTSGTAITVDPVTGEENTLPLRGIEQLLWSPPVYERVQSLTLDADLYYLAPDQSGLPQLYRLLRNGDQGVQALTQSTIGIRAFSISPDKRLIALQEGQRLRVLPLTTEALIPPTPDFFGATLATPEPLLEITLRRSDSAAPAWSFDSAQVAYADEDGIYVALVGGTSSPRRIVTNAGQRYDYPQFSPDGRSLLLEDRNAASGTRLFSVVTLATGTPPVNTAPLVRNGVDTAFWSAPNDSRVGVVILRLVEGTTRISLLLGAEEQTVTGVNASILTAAFARHITTPPLLVLVRRGWTRGPQVIQYAQVPLIPADSAVQILTDPVVLAGETQLSPTGRFIFAVQKIDSPSTSNQLVIFDLQNQRKILIDNAVNISDLRWVF